MLVQAESSPACFALMFQALQAETVHPPVEPVQPLHDSVHPSCLNCAAPSDEWFGPCIIPPEAVQRCGGAVSLLLPTVLILVLWPFSPLV